MTQDRSCLIKCVYESLLDSCKQRRWSHEQRTYLLNAFPAWVRSGNWPSFGYTVDVRINLNFAVNDPKGTVLLMAIFPTSILCLYKLK